MNLSDFNFTLPDDLIALEPANPRDSSRLLVIGEKFTDMIYRDLPSLLGENDLLVFNNSKVIPARLFAQFGGREFEVLLHRKKALGLWTAFVRGSKKLRVGDELVQEKLRITIMQKYENGEIEVRLSDENLIEEYGHMPLPPYIKRADNAADRETYQTVYAAEKGSVAAPTAGLHFTDELLAKIPNKAFVTLHVGAGTFQPVKTEDILEHKMHSEWYEISAETSGAIARCKAAGGRVIAVGTTSARVLEASGGVAGTGDTDIFIYPSYKFGVMDGLLTNFHLPKSSLFMLVSAVAGVEKMQAAYAHAVANRYRFYSYGDACFILVNGR
jgi:S-adenosylmethionine:tRNA ribosyltransferase-isomerase